MRALAFLFLLVPLVAWSSDRYPRAEASASASQSQSASASSTSTASPSQSAAQDNSVRAVGFGGSPVQVSPIEGCPLYLPGDGHNRSWWVLGVSTSGVLERNDECWEAWREQVAHERDLELRRLALEERKLDLAERKLEVEARQRFVEAQEK